MTAGLLQREASQDQAGVTSAPDAGFILHSPLGNFSSSQASVVLNNPLRRDYVYTWKYVFCSQMEGRRRRRRRRMIMTVPPCRWDAGRPAMLREECTLK